MFSEQTLTAMIVPFYLGKKPDLEGRTIQQIWTWNFEELECVHIIYIKKIRIALEGETFQYWTDSVNSLI